MRWCRLHRQGRTPEMFVGKPWDPRLRSRLPIQGISCSPRHIGNTRVVSPEDLPSQSRRVDQSETNSQMGEPIRRTNLHQARKPSRVHRPMDLQLPAFWPSRRGEKVYVSVKRVGVYSSLAALRGPRYLANPQDASWSCRPGHFGPHFGPIGHSPRLALGVELPSRSRLGFRVGLGTDLRSFPKGSLRLLSTPR